MEHFFYSAAIISGMVMVWFGKHKDVLWGRGEGVGVGARGGGKWRQLVCAAHTDRQLHCADTELPP